jgi:hypothetical protein
MELNWKFLKNNSSEAADFEPFLDAFVDNGRTGFSLMSQQFYSYNEIESVEELTPIAKIIFNDLELYIGGRWCRTQVEFLISIPHWQITYMPCIGEDCRRVYNLHYSRYCEEQDYIIETMNFRDKLLAFYNWGIKSYISANMCNERLYRISTRGCEECEYCREWRESTSMHDLPKLNDLLTPYDKNNIPLFYKIQIIDKNIIPSAETITNWKLFLRNERKELLTFAAAIGAKKAESKIALLFKIAKNGHQYWLRSISGY